MGKIPESQRPPMTHVIDNCFGHLRPRWMDILVLDAQNDCYCDVEFYDAASMHSALVLTESGVESYCGPTLALPIQSGKPTEEDLRVLMETAMEHAAKIKSNPVDVCPAHKLGEQDGVEFYSPYGEFFGVLTCNLHGWGAFCMPENIFRKKKT